MTGEHFSIKIRLYIDSDVHEREMLSNSRIADIYKYVQKLLEIDNFKIFVGKTNLEQFKKYFIKTSMKNLKILPTTKILTCFVVR